MSRPGYIDLVYDRDMDVVRVWERDEEGRRVVEHACEHYFFALDEAGSFKNIFGEPVEKRKFKNAWKMKQAVEEEHNFGRATYEADFKPVDRVLTDLYYHCQIPPLHAVLLDIEVDYRATPPPFLHAYSADGVPLVDGYEPIHPDKLKFGFPTPSESYAAVNAITLYRKWEDIYYIIAVPPTPAHAEMFDECVAAVHTLSPDVQFELVFVDDEATLLDMTLTLIEDADILSGWNSETFDMPTLGKRTIKALGEKALARWTFPDAPVPVFDEFESFGRKQMAMRMQGRVHLDYLDLFKKFTFGGRESYSLDAVSQDEVDRPKLHFEGTLEQLYTNDFPTFVAYNFRDVESLVHIDRKKKFIDLANLYAHQNTCALPAVLGTVKMTDAAINNYAIHELGLRVHTKKESSGLKVEGAVVLSPRVGIHEFQGSVDINSLYPSTYRALNISPETFIGQFEKFAEDWEGVVDADDQLHRLEFDNGTYAEYTGAEWRKVLIEYKWAISPYGTVFDQSGGDGIIPRLLAGWYSQRKDFQKLAKKWDALADALDE